MLNDKVNKIIDFFSLSVLVLSVLIMPLVVDTRVVNAYNIPKQSFFLGLVLLLTLLFFVKYALTKTISLRFTFLDKILGVYLLLLIIAGVFSAQRLDSFWGRNEYFIINIIFLAGLLLYYYLFVNIVTTAKKWRLIYDSLVVAGVLVQIPYLFKVIFKWSFLPFVQNGMWNLVTESNAGFGILVVVVLILSVGQLIKKGTSYNRNLLYIISSLISIATIFTISFSLIWWLVAAASVLLLLLGVNFLKEAKLVTLTALFVVLVASIACLIFGSPKYLQAPLPREAYLGPEASWQITEKTLFKNVKNFVFGSGPGTFSIDFSEFRNVAFNTDPLAWSVRFTNPSSTIFSLIAESGVAISALFSILLLIILGYVSAFWVKLRGSAWHQNFGEWAGYHLDLRLEIMVASIAWLVLTASLIFHFFGPLLWFLWWVLTALVVVGLSFYRENIVREKKWEIENRPEHSLSFSFAVILVVALIIVGSVFGARMYKGELAYAEALHETKTTEAIQKLQESISLRPNVDVYYAALAQAFLVEAVEKAQEENPKQESVATSLGSAVNAARTATDLSPKMVGLWENLAMMYENAAAMVPEAYTWSLKAWSSAKALEPTNPILSWRLGRINLALGNNEEAAKNFAEAVRLKADLLGAYLGLAVTEERLGKVDEALKTYETLLTLNPQNPEALFNYGRVLYNRNQKGDRKTAEQAWLAAVKLQPNYSNALYSLASYYEAKGDKATALKYYYEVRDLNPENKDILKKIKSLASSPEKK